jgi:hypothetical protein
MEFLSVDIIKIKKKKTKKKKKKKGLVVPIPSCSFFLSFSINIFLRANGPILTNHVVLI